MEGLQYQADEERDSSEIISNGTDKVIIGGLIVSGKGVASGAKKVSLHIGGSLATLSSAQAIMEVSVTGSGVSIEMLPAPLSVPALGAVSDEEGSGGYTILKL